MTERELKNYTRGIAYQAIKFKKGKISGDELFAVLRASFGDDVFAEAEKIANQERRCRRLRRRAVRLTINH